MSCDVVVTGIQERLQRDRVPADWAAKPLELALNWVRIAAGARMVARNPNCGENGEHHGLKQSALAAQGVGMTPPGTA